jgi:hypothetical protein
MAKAKETKETSKTVGSKDEQVGFHKGALSTLVKERQEMLKILQIVEQLMQMHLAALKELGVDLAQEAVRLDKNAKKEAKKPIEDMLQ